MSRGIRISEKHGLNPAIPLCYFCNEKKGEIILAGRLMGDREAPKYAVWDMIPCNKCKGYMEMGIICISVKDGEKGYNPYRTGGWAVIKAEAVTKMLDNNVQLLKHVLDKRMMFVEDTTWDAMGIPRGEVKHDNGQG